jgi:hypothetical protein
MQSAFSQQYDDLYKEANFPKQKYIVFVLISQINDYH